MNRMKPYLKGGMPFEIEKFKNVPIELAPIYGWNFNDRLDKERIKQQIDDMIRAGIRAVYVLPEPKNFRTQIPTMLEPEYLSDEYMEYFGFALNYAKENGMLMWLYDEGGWPSGSVCGEIYKRDKSTAKKHLGEFKCEVKKGEYYKIPEDAIGVFSNGIRLISDFTAEADTELKEYRLVDDIVEYTEIGNRKTPYEKAVSFVGNTDINEKRTIDLFLELTHERYLKRFGGDFGTHLTMMFTDEPRPANTAWFSGIEKMFYEKYGYDILDCLPALFTDNEDDNVRIDYRALCGDNLRRVFFDYIREWCHKNNLLFCGHVDLDNLTEGGAAMNYGSTLDLLRGMDVPGVDVIWRQIFPFADGSRVSENTCPFFPRMASSAASQSGGNLSLTESLGVYGLGVTMDQMRYIFNYQAIRGVNIMNPLLISYGTRHHFSFGERPYFNAEIPGHDELTLINNYYSRISYLTATGRRNVRCALYISAEDLNAGGIRSRDFARKFDIEGLRLEMAGIDFDIIDSKGILEGTLSDGVLHIGAASYDAVVLPQGVNVCAEVKKIISSLRGAPKPLLKSSIGFEDLRVSSRVFDDGSIMYLLFNEGLGAVNAYAEISDKRPSYILDPKTGAAYNSDAVISQDGSRVNFSLESGDMIGIIFTESRVEITKRKAYEKSIPLTDFELRRVRKFVIDKSGFYDVALNEEFRPFKLGSWDELFGCDFSGEAEYRTFVELDKISGGARLSLGKLCYSASVYVNDTFIGCAGLSPCEVNINKDILKEGRNKIIIKTANTAANQMLYSDAEDSFSARELTPYNDRARAFEEDSLESGLFGPVTLMTE